MDQCTYICVDLQLRHRPFSPGPNTQLHQDTAAMHLLFNPGLLLATFAGLTTAQNCPYLGPAYPAPASIDAPAFVSASTAFDKALADALASGKIPGAATSYAIQVYSPVSKKPIYASYHTPTTISNRTRTTAVGPDTVFRVHSISKLITVYTILAKLGEKYWDEPVAKYVPEFARLQGGNPAYDADWQEITLGSLASLMSGIGRDCESGRKEGLSVSLNERLTGGVGRCAGGFQRRQKPIGGPWVSRSVGFRDCEVRRR